MELQSLVALCASVALASASGLNPWVPLLGVGVAARADVVTLSGSFTWLSSDVTLAVLAVLLVLDLVGDKVPVLDHVLHVVGLVVAPAAGAVVASAQQSLLQSSDPWLVALVGVVLAGTVHGARASLRPFVSAATGGLGNPVVSAVEDVVAFVVTVLAVLVPVVGLVLFTVLSVVVFRRARRWSRARREAAATSATASGTPPASA